MKIRYLMATLALLLSSVAFGSTTTGPVVNVNYKINVTSFTSNGIADPTEAIKEAMNQLTWAGTSRNRYVYAGTTTATACKTTNLIRYDPAVTAPAGFITFTSCAPAWMIKIFAITGDPSIWVPRAIHARERDMGQAVLSTLVNHTAGTANTGFLDCVSTAAYAGTCPGNCSAAGGSNDQLRNSRGWMCQPDIENLATAFSGHLSTTLTGQKSTAFPNPSPIQWTALGNIFTTSGFTGWTMERGYSVGSTPDSVFYMSETVSPHEVKTAPNFVTSSSSSSWVASPPFPTGAGPVNSLRWISSVFVPAHGTIPNSWFVLADVDQNQYGYKPNLYVTNDLVNYRFIEQATFWNLSDPLQPYPINMRVHSMAYEPRTGSILIAFTATPGQYGTVDGSCDQNSSAFSLACSDEVLLTAFPDAYGDPNAAIGPFNAPIRIVANKTPVTGLGVNSIVAPAITCENWGTSASSDDNCELLVTPVDDSTGSTWSWKFHINGHNFTSADLGSSGTYASIAGGTYFPISITNSGNGATGYIMAAVLGRDGNVYNDRKSSIHAGTWSGWSGVNSATSILGPVVRVRESTSDYFVIYAN